MIAVGLGALVYLYNASNDNIEELYYNDTNVYPTTLRWNRHDSILAVGTSDCQIQVSRFVTRGHLVKLAIAMPSDCTSVDMGCGGEKSAAQNEVSWRKSGLSLLADH